MNDPGLKPHQFRLRPEQKLKGDRPLRRILHTGTVAADKEIKIYALPAATGAFAIMVGKKAGTAVKRNRIKRKIREFLRLNKCLWSQNKYIIVKIAAPVPDELLLIRRIERLLSSL